MHSGLVHKWCGYDRLLLHTLIPPPDIIAAAFFHHSHQCFRFQISQRHIRTMSRYPHGVPPQQRNGNLYPARIPAEAKSFLVQALSAKGISLPDQTLETGIRVICHYFSLIKPQPETQDAITDDMVQTITNNAATQETSLGTFPPISSLTLADRKTFLKLCHQQIILGLINR